MAESQGNEVLTKKPAETAAEDHKPYPPNPLKTPIRSRNKIDPEATLNNTASIEAILQKRRHESDVSRGRL